MLKTCFWGFFDQKKCIFFSPKSQNTQHVRTFRIGLSGPKSSKKTIETFPAYPKTTWCEDSAALNVESMNKGNLLI